MRDRLPTPPTLALRPPNAPHGPSSRPASSHPAPLPALCSAVHNQLPPTLAIETIPKGEERVNRNTPSFNIGPKYLQTNEKRFSNRNSNACSLSPNIRPVLLVVSSPSPALARLPATADPPLATGERPVSPPLDGSSSIPMLSLDGYKCRTKIAVSPSTSPELPKLMATEFNCDMPCNSALYAPPVFLSHAPLITRHCSFDRYTCRTKNAVTPFPSSKLPNLTDTLFMPFRWSFQRPVRQDRVVILRASLHRVHPKLPRLSVSLNLSSAKAISGIPSCSAAGTFPRARMRLAAEHEVRP